MNSFRGLARPPSLILPHKGGGDRLRPIALLWEVADMVNVLEAWETSQSRGLSHLVY